MALDTASYFENVILTFLIVITFLFIILVFLYMIFGREEKTTTTASSTAKPKTPAKS